MKLSVNILTWNNKDTIKKLMDAVYRDCRLMNFEMIFVDNGSTDGTVEIIREWVTLNLTDNFFFIFNKHNKGISIGKNQGFDNSFGEYILVLDGDVVPVDNTIKLLVDHLDYTPSCDAIGMYPNKFVTSWPDAVETCHTLYKPRRHKCACLYYGIYRRKIFDAGLRMSEEGEYGKPGYGWEDHDFFKRMQARGIDQYVVNINNVRGKYYHAINSSIRAMGHDEYQKTSRLRSKQFKQDWSDAAG